MTTGAGRPAPVPLSPEGPSLYGTARSAADTPINALSAALRRLASLVVGRPFDDAELAGAAKELSALADRLEEAAGEGKRMREMPEPSQHPQDFLPSSPMSGYTNPIAPPVEFWAARAADGTLELQGRATFGYQYEGPPTCVHGGVIAELFDELLGSANIMTGRAGFTGTLTIRFRRPTPLLTPLELRARQTGVEGRKIFAWGGIYHDGELTAEAEGVFIEVGPTQLATIVDGNVATADGPVVDDAMARFVEKVRTPES